MQPIIYVDKLSKNFLTRKSSKGIAGALSGIFNSKVSKVEAIDEISFEVKPGERIAFIGPNGAGKSTTIKMMTGILYPTSGTVEVLGLVPWKDRTSLGYRIGTVFGQRTQLWYHLPPSDTFDLLARIYEMSPSFYQKQLKSLTEAFEIGPFIHKPVKQLSLGERMRCELVASLLHHPKILFLDEPTIGLDINAKLKIRTMLNRLSTESQTTLFLTSHDTADIEQVCDRVLILNKGKIILDSSIRDLKGKVAKTKILKLTSEEEKLSLHLPGMQVLENRDFTLVCKVDLNQTPIEQVIHEALKLTSLKDISIEDPSMEEIIRAIYGQPV